MNPRCLHALLVFAAALCSAEGARLTLCQVDLAQQFSRPAEGKSLVVIAQWSTDQALRGDTHQILQVKTECHYKDGTVVQGITEGGLAAQPGIVKTTRHVFFKDRPIRTENVAYYKVIFKFGSYVNWRFDDNARGLGVYFFNSQMKPIRTKPKS